MNYSMRSRSVLTMRKQIKTYTDEDLPTDVKDAAIERFKAVSLVSLSLSLTSKLTLSPRSSTRFRQILSTRSRSRLSLVSSASTLRSLRLPSVRQLQAPPPRSRSRRTDKWRLPRRSSGASSSPSPVPLTTFSVRSTLSPMTLNVSRPRIVRRA